MVFFFGFFFWLLCHIFCPAFVVIVDPNVLIAKKSFQHTEGSCNGLMIITAKIEK